MGKSLILLKGYLGSSPILSQYHLQVQRSYSLNYFETRNKDCKCLKKTKIWRRVNKILHAFELVGKSSD